MKLGHWILLALLLALGASFVEPRFARAADSQGVANVGSPSNGIKPLLIGGVDVNDLARFAHLGANGGFTLEGTAADGTSTGAANPLLVAGKDSAGNVRIFRVIPNGQTAVSPNVLMVGGVTSATLAQALGLEPSTGCLLVTQGFNGIAERPLKSAVISSNGTTPVQLVAGQASVRVVALKGTIANVNTTCWHHAQLKDSSTGEVVCDLWLNPGEKFALSDPSGATQTSGGADLQLVLPDFATELGAANDVKAHLSAYVRK